MEIKRYVPEDHYCYSSSEQVTPEMVESPDGEYYSRTDLIAAGCLVPVPDGEACEYQNTEPGVLFAAEGEIATKNGQRSPYSGGEEAWVFNKPHPLTLFSRTAIVQPVRLVRLEDLG